MSDPVLSERRIILGLTGSIAAYKTCELVRRLRGLGAEVRVVMTVNAMRFVGEETMQCLSGKRVLTDMFGSGSEEVPRHLSVRDWADLIVVAPATANIIGKAASGIADDLLSTIILSAMQKVVFAPAMNSGMYENLLVQENIATLRRAGCQFVGPQRGVLASGDEGTGRLADTNAIIQTIEDVLKDAS